MNPTTTLSSTSKNTALIPRSPTIIYFDDPLKGAGIIESQCGYELEFRSNSLVDISIKHNCTFNQLMQKISKIIDHKMITHIGYRRLIKVRNNHLLHNTVEIKCNNDIAQMINWWKKYKLYID